MRDFPNWELISCHPLLNYGTNTPYAHLLEKTTKYPINMKAGLVESVVSFILNYSYLAYKRFSMDRFSPTPMILKSGLAHGLVSVIQNN